MIMSSLAIMALGSFIVALGGCGELKVEEEAGTQI